MLMHEADRRAELRTFLMQHRARIGPQDVGLPASGRRRVTGLRREEVAELAGVSARWYERFESGSSDRRFSSDFVQRVAHALLLEGSERVTLSRLALPEVAAAIEVFERSANDGALNAFAIIRDFSRLVAGAASYEDAASEAINTIQRVLRPNCITVANFDMPDAPPEAIAVGPRAHLADNVLARTVLDMNAPARTGATMICECAPDPYHVEDARHPVRIRHYDRHDVTGLHEPHLEHYREYNARVLQRSGVVVGLFERSRCRGNMTSFWIEPRAHSDLEINVMETIAAILELSAAPPP
jgi:transcriptional regulator with XRE-family HTH domain